MVVRLHPGCPGTAARLPIPPGSQKPMPPASALTVVGANAIEDSTVIPAKPAVHRQDEIECRVIQRPPELFIDERDIDCRLFSDGYATCWR